MSKRSETLTGTPADLISYQNELIRTKNYTPLGRANKIAIAPSGDWIPPAVGQDPFIDRFGRLIDLRSRFLPMGFSPNRTELLITARLGALEDGVFRPGLPDVPDPLWKAADWTPDESGYLPDGTPVNPRYPGQPKGWMPPGPGDAQRVTINRDIAKDTPRMLPQRLEDRAEKPGGRLGTLEGTNFLVFQPVVRIAYQPEILQDGRSQLQAAMWTIECGYDDATSTHPVLLVDPKTGEAHFYGGKYDIIPTE
jgi:hypothetical protein